MSKRRFIAVDFDGVIAHFDGWKAYEFGEPRREMIERLNRLREELEKEGFEVHFILYSTRNSAELEALVEWLQKHELDEMFTFINMGSKPYCHLFIDDRALYSELLLLESGLKHAKTMARRGV